MRTIVLLLIVSLVLWIGTRIFNTVDPYLGIIFALIGVVSVFQVEKKLTNKKNKNEKI